MVFVVVDSPYNPLLTLLFFYYRIRNCLTQLYAKDITPDEKQELDEALQREVWHLPPLDIGNILRNSMHTANRHQHPNKEFRED